MREKISRFRGTKGQRLSNVSAYQFVFLMQFADRTSIYVGRVHLMLNAYQHLAGYDQKRALRCTALCVSIGDKQEVGGWSGIRFVLPGNVIWRKRPMLERTAQHHNV